LQTNEAFLEYESVRHRLPAVSEIGQCLHLSNLEDLIDEIDVFLLDAFGVLNIGILQSKEFLKEFQNFKVLEKG